MPSAESIFLGLAKEQFGLILGIGVGEALAAALEPQAVAIRQTEYDGDPNVAVDPVLAAAVVAEAVELVQWGRDEARKFGINADRFDAIVGETLNAPALGELFAMWRRNLITDGDFVHGLRKAKMEGRWDGPLEALKDDRLDLGAIATAVHRGIMGDDGLLVTPVPEGAGSIPRIPPSTIDPVTEAAAHGINKERLRVLVADTGLPLAHVEMLRLLNMGHVSETDVKVAIAESNTRNEYMDAALFLRRRLLTPHEYAEAELRGVMQHDPAQAGAGLSGLEPADYATLFQILGRPLAVHQITQGLAHGEALGGSYDDVPEPYRDAIRRSNIRPEYAKMAYANRYNYPSAFVLRTLTSSGDITETEAHDILTFEGWEPTLAAKVAAKWAAPLTGGADPWVTKADTQLWTATHKGYKGGTVNITQAQASFDLIGVAADAQTAVLARWDAERAL